MDFIYLILIAMANNIDNISVRISYSIRGVKISTLKNLWIAIITFSISFLSGFFGKVISGILGLNSFLIAFFSALISFLVLWIGNYITAFFNKFNLGNKAIIVAGVMLIVIGLKQVI